jgi:hypothetical protein
MTNEYYGVPEVTISSCDAAGEREVAHEELRAMFRKAYDEAFKALITDTRLENNSGLFVPADDLDLVPEAETDSESGDEKKPDETETEAKD